MAPDEWADGCECSQIEIVCEGKQGKMTTFQLHNQMRGDHSVRRVPHVDEMSFSVIQNAISINLPDFVLLVDTNKQSRIYCNISGGHLENI